MSNQPQQALAHATHFLQHHAWEWDVWLLSIRALLAGQELEKAVSQVAEAASAAFAHPCPSTVLKPALLLLAQPTKEALSGTTTTSSSTTGRKVANQVLGVVRTMLTEPARHDPELAMETLVALAASWLDPASIQPAVSKAPAPSGQPEDTLGGGCSTAAAVTAPLLELLADLGAGSVQQVPEQLTQLHQMLHSAAAEHYRAQWVLQTLQHMFLQLISCACCDDQD